MLDAFTSKMCADPWGRLGFARALIEVSADKELKKEVIMAVPNKEGNGHSMEHIRIEYEWKPSLCLDCHVFGHSSEQCPKKVIADVNLEAKEKEVKDDGFTTVSNHRKKGKNHGNNQNKQAEGVKLNKQKVTVAWKKVTPTNQNSEKQKAVVDEGNSLKLKNHFEALYEQDDLLNETHVGEKSVDLMVIAQSNQVGHVKVIHKTTRQVLFLSFIYATNLPTVRRFLWRNLEAHKYVVRGNPWALMGDFNVALNTKDYYSGSSIMSTDMNQKPRGGGGVFKKLDLVMGNIAFCGAFQGVSLMKSKKLIYLQAFNEAKLDEERFLKQKANIKWLDVGDSKSKVLTFGFIPRTGLSNPIDLFNA
ncbi:RNA-directed DNA polymerase, eukaryota, reverse transcriptase zinc-binding domain protein [Tanacetum coccineum]